MTRGDEAGWSVRTTRGDTAAFHATDPAPARAAVFHETDRRTLVLGSSQRASTVERHVADALSVDVVSRRSGGGGVLLLPGEFVWLDLVIPAGDPLWSDDVGQAMVWVGNVWAAALASLGIAAEVHTGAFRPSEWSAQVCWAGTGTGEVVVPATGAKLVGISQRRTRRWARFQSMCHLRWRPELVAAVVAAPRPSPAALATIAAEVPADAPSLRAALVAALPR